MQVGLGAAPAGAARNPVLGRPQDPIGGALGPLRREPAGLGLAQMPRPKKRGPGSQKSPPWSAERRASVATEATRLARRVGRLRQPPRGLAPSPRVFRRSAPSRGRGRDDGLPGAAQIIRAHTRALLEYGRWRLACRAEAQRRRAV